MNAWLGSVPTTNLRIVVTIALIFATGVRVLITWSPPPMEWLGFLAISAGLDITQFHSKRVTTFQPNGTKATEEASV